MEKTKVTLIYWGLSLFVFLALMPWIFNLKLALYSIQALCIYGGIVVAFWAASFGVGAKIQYQQKDLWLAIGFSLLGLGVSLATFADLSSSLILLIFHFKLFYILKKTIVHILRPI